MEQRRAKRHGLTADKKGFVDAALVDQLTEGGFPRAKAVRWVHWTGGGGSSTTGTWKQKTKEMNGLNPLSVI